MRKEAQLNKSISAAEIASIYEKRLDNAAGDDEARTSATTIESAITVYDKVFSIPVIRRIIEECEQDLLSQSPFNSIAKLLEIYYKCKTTTKLEWWFRLAKDGLDSRSLEPGDFSLKKLRGAPSKPGLTELILMKRSMRDFLMTRFLDTRNIHADYKQKLRTIFTDSDAYRAKFRPLDGTGDTSFLAAWPQSASKALDMIETTCFLFCGQEDATIKIGIKSGKTAQEILEGYQPWKQMIEEIDATLKSEHSTMKTDEDADEVLPSGSAAAEGASKSGGTSIAGGSSAAGTAQQASTVTKTLSVLEDNWLEHAQRHISKFCVLIVESSCTQTQLQASLQGVALGTVQGGRAGNVIITFDCNLFGESVTAPHVRKAPLQQVVINKMWKAVQACRATSDQTGLFPVGDVLVLIDGGRKSDQFLNYFGMGTARRNADKNRKQREGKTLLREVIIALDEKSVKARKLRKKSRHDLLQCTQKAYVLHNSLTHIGLRMHKHFSDTSNMSNMLGPVTLTPWVQAEKLTVKAR